MESGVSEECGAGWRGRKSPPNWPFGFELSDWDDNTVRKKEGKAEKLMSLVGICLFEELRDL